MDIKTIDIKV